MKSLLLELESRAAPDLLTVTIDSHTRLKHFATAEATLARNPGHLNGYPLVAHGWGRGRELNESVKVPLEVRHGSPDARELLAVSLASGIASFEGGGISYNLPYAKDVPLQESLEAWRQVDSLCGVFAEHGVIVDREMFGTLTAVLVPPSISLAISVLEAVLAAREGVRCVSIAYPQGGEALQDIAALHSIPLLAERYLPESVETFSVLHQYMGVFPKGRSVADALILYGGLVGRIGGAAKIITKTNHEAYGIPDTRANVEGMRVTEAACSSFLDFVQVDQERVALERDWILCEVAELVEPLLACDDLVAAICRAFANGSLDVPFSASRHARSAVIPARDTRGAIRYRDCGSLPFSEATRKRQAQSLSGTNSDPDGLKVIESITADINYFAAHDVSKGEPLPQLLQEAS
ncbi:Glutamate mutase subunit E [Glycomyces harbinensis]|uniref:Glutamate mutase subunit E n=2 Tax=Glycomyces harbinensis TaxID=58114 RepID=A0A1G7D2H3_9ACTN|nr:Glutamate mutase subunit E [Glycomyces harbinensis]